MYVPLYFGVSSAPTLTTICHKRCQECCLHISTYVNFNQASFVEAFLTKQTKTWFRCCNCPPSSDCSFSMATTEAAAKGDTSIGTDQLIKSEIFWRTLQPWLLTSGYQLRERFAHDWTPSWLKVSKHPLLSPDGLPLMVSP